MVCMELFCRPPHLLEDTTSQCRKVFHCDRRLELFNSKKGVQCGTFGFNLLLDVLVKRMFCKLRIALQCERHGRLDTMTPQPLILSENALSTYSRGTDQKTAPSRYNGIHPCAPKTVSIGQAMVVLDGMTEAITRRHQQSSIENMARGSVAGEPR